MSTSPGKEPMGRLPRVPSAVPLSYRFPLSGQQSFGSPYNYWSDQPLVPSCLTSMVQGAFDNLVVWGIVPWHTLASLVPTEHKLNTTPFLTIVPDNAMPLYDHGVSIFWWLLPAGQCSMSQNSSHLKLICIAWQRVHCAQSPSTVTRSKSNKVLLGCGMWWHKSAASAWWCHAICTKISQECVFKAVVIERALSVLCLP